MTEASPEKEGGAPRMDTMVALRRADSGYLLCAGGAEGLPVFGHAKSPLAVANGLLDESSTLVDAGTGFEPVTFRL